MIIAIASNFTQSTNANNTLIVNFTIPIPAIQFAEKNNIIIMIPTMIIILTIIILNMIIIQEIILILIASLSIININVNSIHNVFMRDPIMVLSINALKETITIILHFMILKKKVNLLKLK